MAWKTQVESMKNPFRAVKDWRRQALERARTKGALHVFWFYLSMGLAWSLLMIAVFTALEYYDEGALDFEDFQTRALIYFVGGLFFGFVMWVLQETPGTGHSNTHR